MKILMLPALLSFVFVACRDNNLSPEKEKPVPVKVQEVVREHSADRAFEREAFYKPGTETEFQDRRYHTKNKW